ncbi:methyltransferase domain-containing protein [Polymorphobacter arshaanensis]|uniref:Methyltransferase domain-containing protein n=1 Tax=Glacieibacterium arshaanense TaxID=2511025 RepID=A0A4Y9EL28_9SPHN|nr:class I SAM-dependent methyltransferase [Polymorphobacter arshaanensis]TFU01471.1 methyltransferase domain-containing protein [Polymorphobacter arshaanensis]
MTRSYLTLALAALIATPVVAAPAVDPALTAAINGPQRSAANKARDAYRHPAETLTFFGLKPNQNVVEISPSAGWYTEILAPYLKAKGSYTAAGSDPAASERAAKGVAAFQAKLAADPAAYDKVKVGVFAKGVYDKATPAGSADMVLTFRNVHNWYIGGFAPEAFKAFYAMLKPGGTLGVVEHHLPESMPDAMQEKSGYMKQSTVVKLAEAAGFKLVGTSNINANPKDTHDYPKGVWTLPPNYAEGETDKAKYAAIGESDRMTLKFVKPK